MITQNLTPKDIAFLKGLKSQGVPAEEALSRLQKVKTQVQQVPQQPQLQTENQSWGERFMESGKSEIKSAFDISGQARQKFQQGEYIEGLGKVFASGAKAIASPFNAAIGATIQPAVTKGIQSLSPENQQKVSNAITWVQENYDKLPDDVKTLAQVAEGALNVSTVAGGVKLAEGIGRGVAKTAAFTAPKIANAPRKITDILSNVKTTIAQKTAEQVDDLVGKIAQGRTVDIAPAKKALKVIDTKGIKTFDDLHGVVTEKIGGLSRKLDDFLDEIPTRYKISDLTKTTKVGERVVQKNFVDEAFNGLEELYTKIDDTESLAKILNLKDKAVAQGLSVKEINNLAREYGQTLASKGFNKLGDPLTSVNAAKFENVRKGIKEAVRSKIPSEIPKIIDSEISDLYTLQNLSGKMIEKVNRVAQTMKKTNILEKLGAKGAEIFNTVTFGGPRALLYRFLFKGNVGQRMDALDIEKELAKNIKRLSKLAEGSEDDIVNFMKSEMKTQFPFLKSRNVADDLIGEAKKVHLKETPKTFSELLGKQPPVKLPQRLYSLKKGDYVMVGGEPARVLGSSNAGLEVKFVSDGSINTVRNFDKVAKATQFDLSKMNAQSLVESSEGWDIGLKNKFDNALIHGDAQKVRELLPKIPEKYKSTFSSEIDKLLKKKPSIDDLINKGGGWEKGLKNEFDLALYNNNVQKVKELLPKVPKYYRNLFKDRINNLLGK